MRQTGAVRKNPATAVTSRQMVSGARLPPPPRKYAQTAKINTSLPEGFAERIPGPWRVLEPGALEAFGMQAFTSVSLNYLPKARVLAETLKQQHPEAGFHLVLSDRLPEWLAGSPAPFDSILQVEQLAVGEREGLDLSALAGRAVHGRQGRGLPR